MQRKLIILNVRNKGYIYKVSYFRNRGLSVLTFKEQQKLGNPLEWWAREDSNLRPMDYEGSDRLE